MRGVQVNLATMQSKFCVGWQKKLIKVRDKTASVRIARQASKTFGEGTTAMQILASVS